MDAARYARVHKVFDAARRLEAGARSGYLDSECGEDGDLRLEVESLLEQAADAAAPGRPFSDRRIEASREEVDRMISEEVRSGSAPGGPRAGGVLDDTPETIDRYRVIRRIASGGMGTVYEAEQGHPKRRVAIKMIDPRRSSPALIARFRREAEILGRLKHPGIAQIHDVGTIDFGEGGQPYLVMELVEGEPLTKYADASKLDLRGRLGLLARICDAIDYAHQRGVVHRDLKPDNILVDADGRPKVLDFGIARVTDESTLVATQVTQDGQLLGTLTYMAPEQLGGSAGEVTPRTDVYALGVVAFELLAGRLPHDVSGLALTTAIRLLTQEEVPRLRTCVPGSRGDVETIVGMAVAKEPERRYPSAAALATDIRRFLDDHPIAARPPSRIYRIRKFTRRHRALVAGVAATILTLIAGLILTSILGLRERDQRRASERLAYRSSMIAASRAVADHRPDLAERHLNDAPERLRRWEWRALTSRLEAFGGGELLETAGARVLHFRVAADGTWYATGDDEATIRVHDAATGAVQQVIETPGQIDGLFIRPGGEEILAVGPGWIHVWERRSGRLRLDHAFAEKLRGRVRPVSATMTPRPDGNALLVAAADTRLLLVDIETGALLMTGPALRAWSTDTSWYAHSMAYSADGSTLAVTGRGGSVILVDPETLAVDTVIDGPAAGADTLNVCDVDPDGTRLVATNGLTSSRMWNIAGSEPVEISVMDAREEARPARFSPDGATVATATVDGLIQLWDARRGTLLRVLTGASGRPAHLVFWPDGQRLARVGDQGEVRIWDVRRDDPGVLRHASFVYASAVTPDGATLVTGAWDGYRGQPGCLRWWDVATGRLIAAWGGSTECISSLGLSPDGRCLVASVFSVGGDRDPEAIVFEMATGEEIGTLGGQYASISFDPTGRSFVPPRRGGARVVDLATLETLIEIPVDASESAWSNDGRSIGLAGSTIEVWDVAGGTAERRWSVPAADRVLSIAFDAASRRLVACAGGDVDIRDVDTGDRLVKLPESGRAFCAVFSPDGSRLAVGERDGVVRIWSTETNEALCELLGHTAYVKSLRWTPDGETLISTSGDGTARIWDARPLEERRRATAERNRLVEELEPMVRGLFDELTDASQVAARVEADGTLSTRGRQVARQLVLRESLARRR